jgi:HK97 family phage major capsid protein
MNIMMELRQARAAKVDEMKAMTTQAEVENRDFTPEEQTKWDGIVTQVDGLDKRMERLEKLEKAEEATPAATQTQARKAPAFNKTRLGEVSEARAVASYIRSGDSRDLLEWRAANNTIANEGTAADGLNAVPTGHYQNIIAKRDETMLAGQLGVMRIPGTGLTVNVPTDAETDLAFAATNEQDDNYAQTYERDWPALGTVAMTLLKYTKKIALTEELLEDEDSNLLAFVENFVGRSIAATHNSLLLTELRASGTAGLTLDSASTIGAAELPELIYKLPGEYADGAVWVMARATEGLIRGLQGDAFLYVPNPAGSDRGRPEIWGFPVYNSTAASAIAASAKSLVFGNMSFVGMREGTGMQFLRDPYTTDGIVYLKYRFRAVYKVLQAEAVQYATHPTA